MSQCILYLALERLVAEIQYEKLFQVRLGAPPPSHPMQKNLLSPQAVQLHCKS